jgi:hypothetical protein
MPPLRGAGRVTRGLERLRARYSWLPFMQSSLGAASQPAVVCHRDTTWLMVRTAQLIQKTVFLSVNNPLTPMAETHTEVAQLMERVDLRGVTGVVLAGLERWLCMLEGEHAQVQTATALLEGHLRPKQWHVLMSDSRAKLRMFPGSNLHWRSRCSHLEMAVFFERFAACALALAALACGC